MVAVMSLDITSAIVQMALSQKDTLASRWWVVLSAVSQLLVHTSTGVVLAKTFPISPARQDPCQACMRVVWWGTFDSCNKVPWTFWVYWILRTVLVMRSCAIGLHHMHFYDLGERISRGEKLSQEISWSGHLLRLVTFTDPTKDTTTINPNHTRQIKAWSLEAFPRMPATTLTEWVLWTLPAVVAVSSLERMLSLFNLSNPGNIGDWGQTTTFMAVICGLVARAIYLFHAKLKRRSCQERTKAATELSKLSTAQKIEPSTEDFVSLASKFKSFRDIRKVLQPVDCVRWELPKEVWYQYIDLEEAEKELLISAALNDTKGLIQWAKYVPDLSMVVDNMGRTALHLALEKKNLQAIETIMGLMGLEPQPEQSSVTACVNMEKLLKTHDKTGRTLWDTIMYPQRTDLETLGAFLRFRHPVRHLDNSGSLSQIINMIFTLFSSRSLDIMKAWFGAAEKTQSLRELQEHIVQAVKISSGTGAENFDWAVSVFILCEWQFDDMSKNAFATRLIKVFLERLARRSSIIAHFITSHLARSLQQEQVWAIESRTDIAWVVASSTGSLNAVRLVIESNPHYPQIEEQVLMGAVSNRNAVGFHTIQMILKTWPDQVKITPRVLEALLADTTRYTRKILKLLLAERAHQVQITKSMLVIVAKNHYLSAGVWKALLESHRTQIEMTQEVFNAIITAPLDPVESDQAEEIAAFGDILKKWPQATEITRAVLLSLIPQNRVDVFELLHELRQDELENAIDIEVLICLARSSTKNEGRSQDGRKRFVVDFFFERYPEKCKASITDQVLSKIMNDDKRSMAEYEAYRTAQYFKDFRRSQHPRLTRPLSCVLKASGA
jgi:hypothetical protein